MNTMKVSIITVTLNCITTIKQTIESVLYQTYENIEYIIVDGGSIDGTLESIKIYEPLFKGKMKYVSEHDKGLYDAMNKGIKMSQGDIVAFINSDDWYDINAVSNIIKIFNNPKVDIVFGAANVIIDDKVKEIWKADTKEILYRMPCCHQAVFAKRNLFYEIGMFDQKYLICADYDWLLKAYSFGLHIVCTQHILANFRIGGLSYKQGERTIAEHLKAAIVNAERMGLSILIPEILKKVRGDKQEELYRLACIHDLDYIRSLLDGNTVYYIWGTGVYGQECLDLFQILGLDIIGFIDNYITKKYMGKYQIITPEQLDDEGIICIATIKYENEIIQQLQEMGISKKRYFVFSEFKEKVIIYRWKKILEMDLKM